MCHKVAHQTPDSAEWHKESLRVNPRNRDRAHRLMTYYCQECGAWHVGHSKPLGIARRGKRARKV
jgi:hypothetical protein